MAFSESFGARLKSARKSRKVTQVEISRYLGIAKDTYSQYERGRLKPSLDVLTSIVEFFSIPGPDGILEQVTADWLLFGNVEAESNNEFILLEDFGYLIGLKLCPDNPTSAGLAEIGFSGFNVADLLDSIEKQMRESTQKPQSIESLNFLKNELCDEKYQFIAQIRIEKNGVKLVPRFPVLEQSDRIKTRIKGL